MAASVCVNLSRFPSVSASVYGARRHRNAGCSVGLATTVEMAVVENDFMDRTAIRLGLPSKGRMAEETLNLLKNCQLSVRQLNPRQYVADIPQLSNLEVWFQRPTDVVRKLQSGDLDLGIVGLDIVSEHGQDDEDLVIVHDALEYGGCRLSIAIPMYGIFENVNSMKDLAQMPEWTNERPLRIATGFTHLGPKFMKKKGLKHVSFSTADGALEAAPAMGIADCILDLVSSGVTLRENNLKEIEGGTVLQSQAVLVASKRSLIRRKGVLDITHEVLERLEAHLRASKQFMITANMRGNSAEEVAGRIHSQPLLSGLQLADLTAYTWSHFLPQSLRFTGWYLFPVSLSKHAGLQEFNAPRFLPFHAAFNSFVFIFPPLLLTAYTAPNGFIFPLLWCGFNSSIKMRQPFSSTCGWTAGKWFLLPLKGLRIYSRHRDHEGYTLVDSNLCICFA